MVSLPRAFVFRINVDDPHPFPWIRVKLSAAFGAELYPDPQWQRLAGLWESFYPKTGLDPRRRELIDKLEATLPRFVRLVADHRPEPLRGKSLRQAFPLVERRPARLRALYEKWRGRPRSMLKQAPTLVFAALGQARQDRRLNPDEEGRILADLLQGWALRRSQRSAAACVARERRQAKAKAA